MLLALILLLHDDRLLIWPLLGVVAGAYIFYLGFRTLGMRRLILNTPTSKIRSASMGLVELSGLAVGPHTMPAPITGVPCFYFRTTAWELKQSGRNKSWQQVADESLHLPFFLDDNTGQVLVDPQGAEMDIHRDFYQEFGSSFFPSTSDTPPAVAQFLARHGVDFFQNKVKVEEYCIKPKNALFVLGTLAENTGACVSDVPVPTLSSDHFKYVSGIPGVLRGQFPNPFRLIATTQTATAPQVIRLEGNAKPSASTDMTHQEKVASALLRAGINNPAAWYAAGLNPATGLALSTSTGSLGGGAAAVALAPERAPVAAQFDLHPPVVLRKGSHDPAFFISWRSQRDLVRSMGWRSVSMIWGGPALTLLSIYILLAHFGLL
ncbi:MAG: hypothetical protein JOY93_05585 [Acidobacteriales bacterium]|nr:hypothetical protein [Terriglobales bacterium]